MKARFDLRDFTGPVSRFGICLLYGAEPDLVEERSVELTRHIAGAMDDPFRVATLSADEHAQLAAEVSARSLTGGRRVVRVRDCGERLLPALSKLGVSGSDSTFLILAAGALTKKSKLRNWAEQSDVVAAIACNPDDLAQRRAFIESTLTTVGLTAGRDTRDLLAERLPSGRRAMAAELEKLSLLAGSGELDRGDASELLDGDAGATIYSAIDAALSGDGPAALAAWEASVEAGASGVGFVRIAGGELGRLSAIKADVERGASAREALERQRIYNRDPRFQKWMLALRRWTVGDTLLALGAAHDAEVACKSTGSDERLVVADLLSSLVERCRVSRSG